MTIAAYQIEQALLAKLSKFILGLGDAVAERNEDVAGREPHLFLFEHNLRKQSDDEAASFELPDFSRGVDQERGKMSAIGIHEGTPLAVVDAQKQRRVLLRRSAVVEMAIEQRQDLCRRVHLFGGNRPAGTLDFGGRGH